MNEKKQDEQKSSQKIRENETKTSKTESEA
jgi:hypothetical protein